MELHIAYLAVASECSVANLLNKFYSIDLKIAICDFEMDWFFANVFDQCMNTHTNICPNHWSLKYKIVVFVCIKYTLALSSQYIYKCVCNHLTQWKPYFHFFVMIDPNICMYWLQIANLYVTCHSLYLIRTDHAILYFKFQWFWHFMCVDSAHICTKWTVTVLKFSWCKFSIFIGKL